MSLSEELHLEAYIAQIDCEKAFHSIEWPFLFETLTKFGFAEISYVRSNYYTTISTHVLEIMGFFLPFLNSFLN